MKKSRFTEEQTIGFIKQAEAGLPISAGAELMQGSTRFVALQSRPLGQAL